MDETQASYLFLPNSGQPGDITLEEAVNRLVPPVNNEAGGVDVLDNGCHQFLILRKGRIS